MIYDTVVIGGGPSGLMAAIAASEFGAKTILIEKGKKLGTKLAISGGGRCNVTNRLPQEEIIKNIPGNGKFLYGPFSVFDNEDIIEFFESLNVFLKEEDHGRMFPISNSAKSVVDALISRLESLGGEIKLVSPVADIHFNQDSTYQVELSNGTIIETYAIVIATGGKAVPNTGSTGDGYPWAIKAGHEVTELYPTEVALTSNEPFIHDKTLQGLSLRDVKLSVLNKKKKPIISHTMDMIFTHFGVSGPAVLRCSQFVVKQLMSGEKTATLDLDIFPELNKEELMEQWVQAFKEEPRRIVKNILKKTIQERLLTYLLTTLNINGEQNAAEMSHDDLRKLVDYVKSFQIIVDGSLPLEKAFVTGGGIRTNEIEPTSMASRKREGLFFCGEILDIHGYTGGYNITSALATGRIAGMNSAFFALGAH